MASAAKLFLIVSTAALISAACGSDGGAENVTELTPDEPSPERTAEPEIEPASPDKGVVIKATVADGKVKARSDEFEVPLGERVEIAVTSDQDNEIHVHGYDVFKMVPAGETVRVSFTADIPGVFEVELEGGHLTLFELRVQ
jgi:hypothetical protein